MDYNKCTVDGEKGVFIGQEYSIQPDGLVRVVYQTGAMYEGLVINGHKCGFGRYINSNSLQIGWWQKGLLHGICRCYSWSPLPDPENIIKGK